MTPFLGGAKAASEDRRGANQRRDATISERGEQRNTSGRKQRGLQRTSNVTSRASKGSSADVPEIRKQIGVSGRAIAISRTGGSPDCQVEAPRYPEESESPPLHLLSLGR